MMKRKLIALSQRYVTALRKHLEQGPRTSLPSLQPARGLGRQAVAMGLETLDLARIHKGALATMESFGSRDGVIQQAGVFFAEAISPIEEAHRAALKANVRLSRLNKSLGRHMADLAASNRSLKQGIARRKSVEEALKKRGEHSKKLLEESLAVQKQLQYLTRQILAGQEDKRKEISRDLQDEIAQNLLGINLRLLTLNQEAAINAKGLQKEIVSTQQLVDMSVKSIDRFAREFGKNHEA
jgi:two-component system, NarL family, sensor histidine kinase DegS